MFKCAFVIFAIVACVAAKPALVTAPLAYTAPAAVVAAPAPFVTATSSQYVARNHNGIASAPVVAPVAAPIAAAYSTPVAYSAPVVAKYAAAYSAPLTYAAAPLAYSAPLAYANAPLDAAFASSRVDVKQNYNAAVVPATYAAAASVPLASVAPVAPIKYTAAPVLL